MGEVQQGRVVPNKIMVLYQDGKITQIHALFTVQQGHDLDVYLTRQALEEFLNISE